MEKKWTVKYYLRTNDRKKNWAQQHLQEIGGSVVKCSFVLRIKF